MLKTDTVDSVAQFDVDAQIVAVKFEFVARAQPGVLVKVGFECGDRSVDMQLPVPVLRRIGLVVDGTGMGHNGLSFERCVGMHLMARIYAI